MIDTILEQDIEPTRRTNWLSGLTVADGVYVLIVAAAAVMRLVDLGKIPLSPGEASEALAVWRFWQPTGEAIMIGSPAYFSLTSLIIQVLGASDAVMRLVPALFGLGLILLPWFLRPRIGTIGAFVAGLLLAISPLNTVVARTAGGEAIALFAALLLLVAWIRLGDDVADKRRWFYTLFVALGLGLASAPLFYTALVTLVLAWSIQSWLGPKLFEPDDSVRPDGREWRAAIVLGGSLFLALSTLFLWHPTGLGAAAALPARWLAQFSFQGGMPELLNPFLAIGRYEMILFLLGTAAILWATFRGEPLATFCVYWLTAIFVLILLQRGALSNALLITLPGYLLLGHYANKLLSGKIDAFAWGLAGGLTLLGLLLFVNVARYSRIILYNQQQWSSFWAVLLGLIFALATIYFVATWDVRAAYQGTLLGVLALFSFYNWGTSWWLSHYAANDPHERWVVTAADDEVHLFVNVLREISQQTTRSDAEIDIVTAVDTPLLRWYLRDFRNLQISDVLPPGTQSSVVISPVQSDLALGSDYLGADYGLIRAGLQPPEVPSQTPLLDLLRWWLFHESTAAINEERIILWLRADLAQQ